MGIQNRIFGDVMQLIPGDEQGWVRQSQWKRDRDTQTVIIDSEAEARVIVYRSDSAAAEIRRLAKITLQMTTAE